MGRAGSSARVNDAATILIVEDNPDDAELIAYAFENVGVPTRSRQSRTGTRRSNI